MDPGVSEWLGLVVLVLGGWVAKWLGTGLAGLIGRAWLRRRAVAIDGEMQSRVYRSFGAVVMLLLWWCAVGENLLQLPEGLAGALWPLTKFGLAATIGWFGYRLVDAVGGAVT